MMGALKIFDYFVLNRVISNVQEPWFMVADGLTSE